MSAPRALALLAALLIGLPAAAAAQEVNLADIEDEVMCPICGIPLSQAVNAPQAERQRELIRSLIAEGKTKDEIKAVMVAEYGEDVLAVPGTSGFDLAAWVVPGVALLAAGAAIGLGVRRWRRALPEPQTGTGPDLDPADLERLEAELARREGA